MTSNKIGEALRLAIESNKMHPADLNVLWQYFEPFCKEKSWLENAIFRSGSIFFEINVAIGDQRRKRYFQELCDILREISKNMKTEGKSIYFDLRFRDVADHRIVIAPVD